MIIVELRNQGLLTLVRSVKLFLFPFSPVECGEAEKV
jgi:hypothetical protein